MKAYFLWNWDDMFEASLNIRSTLSYNVVLTKTFNPCMHWIHTVYYTAWFTVHNPLLWTLNNVSSGQKSKIITPQFEKGKVFFFWSHLRLGKFSREKKARSYQSNQDRPASHPIFSGWDFCQCASYKSGGEGCWDLEAPRAEGYLSTPPPTAAPASPALLMLIALKPIQSAQNGDTARPGGAACWNLDTSQPPIPVIAPAPAAQNYGDHYGTHATTWLSSSRASPRISNPTTSSSSSSSCSDFGKGSLFLQCRLLLWEPNLLGVGHCQYASYK